MLQRKAWHIRLACVDPSRLVFLDETGAKTNMTRMYARAHRGIRAIDYVPHGHWSTTTLIAALTVRGAIAPMVLDGPMDRLAFDAYISQVLVPVLPPNSIVVMDNLAAHKSPGVAHMLDRVGAQLWYLPPYSPDLNPIELMWSKVKSLLRRTQAHTQEGLFVAIAEALNTVTTKDSYNFFCHSCVPMQS